ncbi:MAG: class II glutamine amidotransferase [SAR324 cluster bacterium]|nr:class II glutamine amidotransferase [SAR324 cluster bacterium]
MCGVCGILYKNRGDGARAPIGADLTSMLASMVHRGADSTGVTVAGQSRQSDLIVRVWAEDDADGQQALGKVEANLEANGARVKARSRVGDYLRVSVDYQGDVQKLADALVDMDGLVIHSIGECSEVIKDVGTAGDLDTRHNLGRLRGTHGIGHVRLATESRVDISHSHPFWAYPYSDVTVVHNGQLTNYHKLKRKYEDMGYRFQTENDSELIAVFLADKLALGATLSEALHDALGTLDGTFTFLVSTRDGLGYAKDQWSAKPLVTMETDDVIAMASEEVALRSVFREEIERVEPQENEVMTWSI